MNRLRTLLIAAVLSLLAVGAVYPLVRRREAVVAAQTSAGPVLPVVQVAPAESRAMSRTLRLSGTLKSGSEASLSPKQGGRIAAVLVAEGQAVRRGQTLIRLDASDAQRQVEQAAAGVRAARANSEKAQEGERLKRIDLERRVNEAQRGVRQAKLQLAKAQAGIRLQSRAGGADVERAQAGVDAARSALAKARAGARPEERRQAQIAVGQAQRGVDLARRALDDIEFLHGKGALPRIRLDEARENHQKALDGLAQARTALELVEAGASAEDIAAADAHVRAAEAVLTAAKAGANREEVDRTDLAAARSGVEQAEAGLRTALATRTELRVAQSDVQAARAAYDQALAGQRLAAQQVTAAAIVSPVDGTVTTVNASVGEMAGPGQPLAVVIGAAGVYLEAAVPSRLLPSVRAGQSATVRVDAARGRTFAGTVRSVGTTAGPDGRSFPVRIDLSAPAGVLKPGGLARAEVQAEAYPDAVTVPVDALRGSGESTAVWVVRAERVVEVPVETPIQNGQRAMVRGDVRAGELVVVSAAPGVSAGDTVRTQTPSGAEPAQ